MMKSNLSKSSLSLSLANSGLLFQTIFNQQFQFMAVLNTNGVVIEVNDMALVAQGVKREDYIGKLFWESPAWQNLPEWKDIWKQRLDESAVVKKGVLCEDVFQVGDGSFRYASSLTSAVFDPDNQILLGYIIQAVDTTKRQLVENKVRENEARLSFILEHSNIGSWDLDLVNNTSVRSLKHDQIFGYDSHIPEWNYEFFLQHVIPQDRADVDHKFQYALKHTVDWNFECRIKRKDGKIRWINASGGFAYEATGKANLMCGIVQDITEIKELQLKDIRHHDELKSVFNALPDTYFRMEADGTILDFITQNESILYKAPENFIGQRMQDVLPDKVGELFQLKINEVNILECPLVFNYELTVNNKSSHFDARLNKIPMNDQLICVVRDISEQVYLNNILEQSQAAAKLGSWVQSFDRDELFWSNEVYRIFEYDLQDSITVQHFYNRVHPDDRSIVEHCFQSSIKNNIPYKVEHRLLFPDGRIKYVLESAEHIYDSNQKHIQSIGTVQDISKQKEDSERHQLSFKVFNETHEGILITNAQQLVVDVNPAFTEISGYSHEDIVGKHPSVLNSGKQSPQFYVQMWESIKKHGFWQGEVWNKTKQGEYYAELLNISSLKNDFGEITHYVGVFSDITDRKRQLEKLNQMAHYDELTNLPNRALFIDRFQQAIAHSARTGHQLAICFLDLDNFKPINDNHGHEAGDLLLIEVASRIKTCIRNEDTVSRQGGDEFAILLNDIQAPSQYECTMRRIHKSLAMPYFITGLELNITASSGITIYPSDVGDIDTLLRHADHAMYQSKLQGKNCFHLYSPDLDQRIIKKNFLVDEVKQALNNHEFTLYYQPKVNMVSGIVFGVEALIRWNHPVKGQIPPLEFLPYIGDTFLDIKVGEWVIENSLKQLDVWMQNRCKLEVSINISTNHLLSPTFYLHLEESLSKYPTYYSQYLQLEILESSAFGDIQMITSIIESCQNKLGVTFSLDDFGTGYSSLTHLKNLPVNTIKIDRSFVRDILDDPSDFAIIEGVIALTKSFNRHVIAEGVETVDHGNMLLLMGCECAQGYQISKPMPIDVFDVWLSEYTPNLIWKTTNSKQQTKKENSLEIFKLIFIHTFNKIKLDPLLKSTNVYCPIISVQGEHCESWLYRQKQNDVFTKKQIEQLESKYYQVIDSVHAIQKKYQKNDIDEAHDYLVIFDQVYQDMIKAIALCE